MLIHQEPPSTRARHPALGARLPGWKLRWMIFTREQLPKWLVWRVHQTQRFPAPSCRDSARKLGRSIAWLLALLALFILWRYVGPIYKQWRDTAAKARKAQEAAEMAAEAERLSRSIAPVFRQMLGDQEARERELGQWKRDLERMERELAESDRRLKKLGVQRPARARKHAVPTAIPVELPQDLVAAMRGQSTGTSQGTIARGKTELAGDQWLPTGSPSQHELSQPDAAESSLAASTSSVEPNNGTLIVNRGTGEGLGTLSVLNGGDHAAVVKLLNERRNLIYSLYVRAGSKAVLQSVDAGEYQVWFCFGRGWDPREKHFVRDRSAARTAEPLRFTETRTSTGTRYINASITLQRVIGGNLRSTSVDAAEFDRLR